VVTLYKVTTLCGGRPVSNWMLIIKTLTELNLELYERYTASFSQRTSVKKKSLDPFDSDRIIILILLKDLFAVNKRLIMIIITLLT
jgi:hypothetical protein